MSPRGRGCDSLLGHDVQRCSQVGKGSVHPLYANTCQNPKTEMITGCREYPIAVLLKTPVITNGNIPRISFFIARLECISTT